MDSAGDISAYRRRGPVHQYYHLARVDQGAFGSTNRICGSFLFGLGACVHSLSVSEVHLLFFLLFFSLFSFYDSSCSNTFVSFCYHFVQGQAWESSDKRLDKRKGGGPEFTDSEQRKRKAFGGYIMDTGRKHARTHINIKGYITGEKNLFLARAFLRRILYSVFGLFSFRFHTFYQHKHQEKKKKRLDSRIRRIFCFKDFVSSGFGFFSIPEVRHQFLPGLAFGIHHNCFAVLKGLCFFSSHFSDRDSSCRALSF
ncbi:hypothetical protein B0H66DRAFT_69463 [Apodospora peruviana]|uniref:Uncharacterized protein n=1 Tax=Apodospora peruviana TaxID=516989 RepID=A0AAE0IT08_9PEZI|nr:hypothetical protein B0H66DRAFT_69463 [Apodospora peruviana]